ncbi:MAG: hypothetical protein O3A13_11235 [Proteobacteria bacterium]|nr:hypothetical protein [Pseudomonadota bacterium]MDA0994187.1 hypothetical protein [Pseudomonadota bacterium]
MKAIDPQRNTIELQPARRGKIPKFDGEAAPVDAIVRYKMRDVLAGSDQPAFCDSRSVNALQHARQYYCDAELQSSPLISTSDSLYWFVWHSDAVINTLALLLNDMGLRTGAIGPVLLVDNTSDANSVLGRVAAAVNRLESDDLLDLVQAKPLGKFDGALSPDLLKHAIAVDMLDLESARQYVETLQ